MWETRMVNEFKIKILMAADVLKVLRREFKVLRVVFDFWYWSEELVKEGVVSEPRSNRRSRPPVIAGAML